MDYDKGTFARYEVLATVLWLDPDIHLDYWSRACGHQVFRPRMLYTEHSFGPKAINFGNW